MCKLIKNRRPNLNLQILRKSQLGKNPSLFYKKPSVRCHKKKINYIRKLRREAYLGIMDSIFLQLVVKIVPRHHLYGFHNLISFRLNFIDSAIIKVSVPSISGSA